MRSYKQQTNNNNNDECGRFLPPAVNSYKQHLAAVKSLLPDRLSHRPIDLRLSIGLSKALHVDSMKQNTSKTVRNHRSAVLACDGEGLAPERCVFSLPVALPVGMVWDLGPQAYRVQPHRTIQSAGAACCQSKAVTRGFSFSLTGITSNSERLDLSRRGLMDFPHLNGGDKLRLLNLQHNFISHLQNLTLLPHLVFLDLYDNHLIDMSGISSLTSLRVLLLGKNRIQRICDLDGLSKLDVLDLHSNQISQIENVSHLSELRLLNLSGNLITRVEKLQGLKSLTELNLQHNHITSVQQRHTRAGHCGPVRLIGDTVTTGTQQCIILTVCCSVVRSSGVFRASDQLPSVLLCHAVCVCGGAVGGVNSSFDELACLWNCRALSELSVDGNPVALESCYRQTVLRCCSSHLHILDMKRVTEEERRTASVSARREDEKKKETHKHTAHKERRRLAIQNAAQQWEEFKSSSELPAQNDVKDDVSPDNSPAHSPALTNGNAQETSPDEPR
ncbi:hypothetical protein E1301_Tti023359 [Triplophysa tibetana]|uniref:Leucine-rich repeat-containing protein 49 n=1 Tax=Triplophysa tibetana TaxID=1572043 RepID=A0A5A9P015_9TELE|nr:hypothetical protein E1301_Tti023359 [Triplophysa tibetana]